MLCTNKLSQHAISQSEARLARHTMPACSSLDKLSQHAVSQVKVSKARNAIPTCSRSQSQIGKSRHAIPAYTAWACYPGIISKKFNCIKETEKAQNSGQADTASSCKLEESEQEE